MSCPDLFKKLIIQCWDKNQVDRPSLLDILDHINAIEKDYHQNQQEWDSLRKN